MSAWRLFGRSFGSNVYSKVLFATGLGLIACRRPFLNAENPSEPEPPTETVYGRIPRKKPNPAFYNNVTLLSGQANLPLAQEIAEYLNLSLGRISLGRFPDGEVSIQINDNVRGKDVYIIQSTSPPVNENLMELLLLISTLRRASAGRINVIMPYYGYARQDRKTAPRVPISAADVARLLETMGIDRVISVDLHCGQIQGFFGPRVPVDNMEANLIGFWYLMQHKNQIDLQNLMVISPDAGGVARAKKFQELLRQSGYPDTGLAMIIKHREVASKIAEMHLVGSVKGSDVIIVDDMIDTAGTLCEAVKVLKNHGAKQVYAFATHGLFNGNAFKNINSTDIGKIIVTNTIPRRKEEENCEKVVRLSVAPLIAECIRRIQENESISALFTSNPH